MGVSEFGGGRVAVVENAWVLPDDSGVWLESETELIGTEEVARLRTPGEQLEVLGASGAERLDPSMGRSARTMRRPRSGRPSSTSRIACSASPPERLAPAESLRALAVALVAVRAAESGRTEHFDDLAAPAQWHDHSLS